MAATATLNVRLPEDLKDRGAQVLRREGVSVSDAVRGLYEYMEKEQRLPEFI
ncbi:MAG: type II toxin-antitoxin system RelB/DinJ family antitoxin, partial [Eggerthella lenta]